MPDQYTARFSHEFDDGPSGPARSYWDLRDPRGVGIGTVCLHPRGRNADPELTTSSIARMLSLAHERGRAEKEAEIRKVLGL
jgi:hypothetical protein